METYNFNYKTYNISYIMFILCLLRKFSLVLIETEMGKGMAKLLTWATFSEKISFSLQNLINFIILEYNFL